MRTLRILDPCFIKEAKMTRYRRVALTPSERPIAESLHRCVYYAELVRWTPWFLGVMLAAIAVLNYTNEVEMSFVNIVVGAMSIPVSLLCSIPIKRIILAFYRIAVERAENLAESKSENLILRIQSEYPGEFDTIWKWCR